MSSNKIIEKIRQDAEAQAAATLAQAREKAAASCDLIQNDAEKAAAAIAEKAKSDVEEIHRRRLLVAGLEGRKNALAARREVLDEAFSMALDELCASAPGTLFLQTAEHILITPDARHILPEAVVSRRLRPAARVYYLQGGTPELSRAGDFLRAHGGGARLTDVRARLLGAEGAPEIATLVCAQGRMRLYGG